MSLQESANCTRCPAGYSSTSGSSQCSACSSGTYAPASSSACAKCDSGKWSNSSAAACTDCRAGRYSGTGAETCVACIAGRISAAAESTCTACSSGKHASEEGSTECKNCTKGRYSGATGEAECQDCQIGYYAATNGAVQCQKCSTEEEYGVKFTSTAGSFYCDQCVRGYYRKGLQDGGKCIACSTGALCKAPGVTLTNMETLKGYYRFDLDSHEVYECPWPKNCKAGPLLNASNHGCKQGATGPLCSLCRDGFYLDLLYEHCMACDIKDANNAKKAKASNIKIMIILGSVLVGLIGLAYAFIKFSKFARKLHRQFREFRKKRRASIELVGAKLSVIIVTIQTIILMAANHEASGGEPLPGVYINFLDVFGWVAFDLFSFLPGLPCINIFKGYFRNVVAQTTSLAVGGILSYLSYFHRLKNGHPKPHGILRLYVVVMRFAISAVSRTITEGFRCGIYDAGQGKKEMFLEVDFRIDCNSKSYEGMMVYLSCMMLIFPLGLPLCALIYLRRLKPHLDVLGRAEKDFQIEERANNKKLKRLKQSEGNILSNTDGSGSDRSVSSVSTSTDMKRKKSMFQLDIVALPSISGHIDVDEAEQRARARIVKSKSAEASLAIIDSSPLAPFFELYRKGYTWWYDVADIMRRLSLTCGTLIFRYTNHFLLYAISVACIAKAAHSSMLPYKHKELNALADIQHWQNLLCLIVMMMRDTNMYWGTSYELLGGVLLMTNLLLIGLVGGSVIPALFANVMSLYRSAKAALKEHRPSLEPMRRGGLGSFGSFSRQKSFARNKINETSRETFDCDASDLHAFNDSDVGVRQRRPSEVDFDDIHQIDDVELELEEGAGVHNPMHETEDRHNRSGGGARGGIEMGELSRSRDAQLEVRSTPQRRSVMFRVGEVEGTGSLDSSSSPSPSATLANPNKASALAERMRHARARSTSGASDFQVTEIVTVDHSTVVSPMHDESTTSRKFKEPSSTGFDDQIPTAPLPTVVGGSSGGEEETATSANEVVSEVCVAAEVSEASDV